MIDLFRFAVQNVRTQGGRMTRSVWFTWRELYVEGMLYEGEGGDDPTTLEDIEFQTEDGCPLPSWLSVELADKHMDELIAFARDAE